MSSKKKDREDFTKKSDFLEVMSTCNNFHSSECQYAEENVPLLQ